MHDENLKPLAFEEAVAYFKDKVPMTAKEYAALIEEARAKAFTVSNVATLDIVQDIYEELLRAIDEGLTVAEFGARINAYIEDKGYLGLTPYRVDNIFRTNIQTAYNAGRYRQQTRPAVAKARPIWIYSAVNDSRTRPSHRAMHGVARRCDDPFWDTWYPPNGYRCRCSVRSASLREVRRRGIKVETGAPPALRELPDGRVVQLLPDVGFEHNPGKAWQPDMSKYAKRLREQFEAKQNRL